MAAVQLHQTHMTVFLSAGENTRQVEEGGLHSSPTTSSASFLSCQQKIMNTSTVHIPID